MWKPSCTDNLSNFLQVPQPPAVPTQTKELLELEEYKSLAKTQLIALGDMASDETFLIKLLSAVPRPPYYSFISTVLRRTKEKTENLPMNPVLVICGDIESNPGPRRLAFILSF